MKRKCKACGIVDNKTIYDFIAGYCHDCFRILKEKGRLTNKEIQKEKDLIEYYDSL